MAIKTADMQYYATLFTIWLISTLFLRSLLRKNTKKVRLPPSPLALPLIGHLYLFSTHYFKSLEKIASKYGPIITLRLGLLQCVLISSAKVAGEIFKAQDVIMSGKPRDIFGFFGNEGFIIAQYGEYWRFMKKLCMTEVLGGPQITRTRNIRHEELTRFLLKLLDSASKKEVVNVSAELIKLANSNISRMALSTRYSDDHGDAEMCRQLVVDLNKLAGKVKLASILGPFKRVAYRLYGKRAIEVCKTFDVLLERIMKEHEERAKREGPNRPNKDLMDILLDVHEDENAEFKITKSQINAFLRDIFVAGTSTIADTIQWAVAEVINHPYVFEKLREEIESVVGKNRLVEESDIPNLPYLQATVKETLRLYSALPAISRAPTEDTKFGEYDIPKGTIILVNAYAMMRDPEVWDNPNEFRPERFLDPDKLKELSKLNFNYIPFGMGRRSCPGATLATASTHLILAAMVQCFDWKVGDGDGKKIDTQIGINVTTTMAYSLFCVPKVHNAPFAAQI